MKKLIITGLLATLANCALAAIHTVDGIEWTYTVSNGEASLGGGSWDAPAISKTTTGAIIIPSTLDGLPVTSIGSYAFENCSGLTSVTIGNGVTSIGRYAFYGCSGLTSVTIPDSVTSIGYEAFRGCSDSLFDVATVPGVKLVDGWAVGHTDSCSGNLDLTGVRGIGNDAFSGCSGLTSVTIPDSVTSIGIGAFYGCSGFMEFVVSEAHPLYKAINGLLLTKDGKALVHGVNGDVTIPDSVTSIGKYAFRDCSGLTSVTIPAAVTSIGDWAFDGCSGLTSVTIPQCVCTKGLPNLFSAYQSITNVQILDGVKSIGEYAFSGCNELESVTIPASVTSIGEYAICFGKSAILRQPEIVFACERRNLV